MRLSTRTTITFALLLGIAGGSLFMLPPGAFAQNADQSAAEVEERRAQLRDELSNIEREIEKQEEKLSAKQRERVSLERDVAILDAQIEKAKLAIQARNIAIRQLNEGISSKAETIDELSAKLDREKDSLARLIRRTNELDDVSLAELMLGNDDFSEFFQTLDALENIKVALKDSFRTIEHTKDTTRTEKQQLEEKRLEEVELRRLQELQKQRIEEREAEKQELLRLTRGQEERYQEIIQEKQKTAAEIRSELFTLRDSAAIPFSKALKLARRAGEQTGVRPAFLLGVLAEESNLGENVGTGTWTEDMHPTRDRPVFAAMGRELGFDPDQMPVSAKPWYGWGGAMGPAQFIPSTWVCYGGLINTKTGDCNNASRSLSWDAFWQGPWEYQASEDRIRNLIDVDRPSNPWENLDAFTASAALLSDNGASRGGKSAERLAAQRYFAGWANAEKPEYAFYGDEVMALTQKYQNQIDILEQSE